MKKIIESVKYELQLYFKGSKFVMPFIMMAVFLYFVYFKTTSNEIVANCKITYYFIFFLTVGIGWSVSSSENAIMEQTVLLRLQSSLIYYLSKVLFLILLGFMASTICVVIPIIINLLNGGTLFKQSMTIYNIINFLLLLYGSSLIGGALGSFFHVRVLKDRKTAIGLMILFTLLTFTKTAVINEFSFTKIFLWILPSLDCFSKIYNNKMDSFQLQNSFIIFLILFIYSVLYFIIRCSICYKNKF